MLVSYVLSVDLCWQVFQTRPPRARALLSIPRPLPPQVSYKVFLVKTRCRGARTPTRAEAEACGASGIELLADEWLVEDFRRGVAHGWSQVKQYIRARLDPGKINILEQGWTQVKSIY